MPNYERHVDIAAPVETVWEVTHDIEAWPSWSPTMDEVTRTEPSDLAPGSTATVRQPKVRPAQWTVDEVTAPNTFTWHTSGPGYRLTAEHHLAAADSGTSVVLCANVSGPLRTIVWLLGGRKISSYVDQEADALKAVCEQRAS